MPFHLEQTHHGFFAINSMEENEQRDKSIQTQSKSDDFSFDLGG